MDDIAAEAGTSKTVFYRHFTDRAGLYAAVGERVDALILRDVSVAIGLGESEPGEPERLVGAAIAAYLRLVERDPDVYRFIVAAPLLERTDVLSEAADPVRSVTAPIAAQIGEVVAGALATQGRSVAAAEVWGHAVVGMVRAAADEWLRPGSGLSQVGRDDLTRHLTRLAWSGLSSAWLTTRTEQRTE